MSNTGACRYVSAFDESLWLPKGRKFLKYVDQALRDRDSITFSNDSTFHAVHLIHSFFLHAAKEMRIFSGILRCHEKEGKESDCINSSDPMKIYDDDHVLGAMIAFLADSGTKLKIVVEGNEEEGISDLDEQGSHPLVKKVEALRDAKMLRGSCEVARIDSDLAGELIETVRARSRVEGEFRHMIIMDKFAYRLEAKETTKAGVNFNDPALAKRLARFFDDSLWTSTKPLWSASREGIDARWDATA